MIVAGCEYIASLYRRLEAPKTALPASTMARRRGISDPAAVDRQAFRRELGISPDMAWSGWSRISILHARTAAPRATRGVGLKGQRHLSGGGADRVPPLSGSALRPRRSGSNDLGEHYRQSLIEDCRADGFIEKVFFPGHRSDLQRVLVSFDVAVQCSLTECLGADRSASDGAPDRGHESRRMTEAVRHEETGLVRPSRRAPALAPAIDVCSPIAAKRSGFARAGRA